MESRPRPAPNRGAALSISWGSIGSRGRVSEVLNRKRPLTLPMVRELSALLQIPAEVLIQPYQMRSAA